MVLVDTSVWVGHLRQSDADLVRLLDDGRVLGHQLVTQELACGHLKNRKVILTLLEALPQAPLAAHAEILDFIERHKLMGQGVGLADTHLLASTMLAKAKLWTADARLADCARRLRLL